jgi:hypothetical protein
MARKRYKPEEIVAKLRQVDVLASQGQNMVDAIRQIGVSEVTYCGQDGSEGNAGVLRLLLALILASELRPRSDRRRGSPWPDLGERWSSRLVATPSENCLNFRRNLHCVRGQPTDCPDKRNLWVHALIFLN